MLKFCLQSFATGLYESLLFHRTFLFFFTSPIVRTRMIQCLLLNGVVFVGSLVLKAFCVEPLTRNLIRIQLPSDANEVDANTIATINNIMESIFSAMWMIFWVYPIYCISFTLSSIWYQDIADDAFLTRGGRRRDAQFSWQRWLKAMSEELYRLLLVGAFLLQSSLFSFIPYLGEFITFIHVCWLYSLYSFEYGWTLQGYDLRTRLSTFESQWPYFAGFGFPCAVITYLFPNFISYGIFAFLFPIFIILAIITESRPETREVVEMRARTTIPIFKYCMKVNDFVLLHIRRQSMAAHGGLLRFFQKCVLILILLFLFLKFGLPLIFKLLVKY